MPVEKPVTAAPDSIVISKPTNSIPEPVKEKTEAKPDAAPYRPTRLVSSSRLYKTWRQTITEQDLLQPGQRIDLIHAAVNQQLTTILVL